MIPATAQLTLPGEDSERPVTIILATNGNYYAIQADTTEKPAWFDWIKPGDIFDTTEDENGKPLISIPIPHELRAKNTKSCWPLDCVQAPVPFVLIVGGVAITPEMITAVIGVGAMTATAASAETSKALTQAESFIILNKVYEKGCDEFQKIATFLTSYLNGSHLNEYNFYYVDGLNDHNYYELKKKYVERSLLSSAEALELMKDCGSDRAIWIGSTEEGCRELADIATRLLGGKGIERHDANHNQPKHVHASRPDENGEHRHCNPHCFWDYDNFFGNSKGGNPA